MIYQSEFDIWAIKIKDIIPFKSQNDLYKSRVYVQLFLPSQLSQLSKRYYFNRFQLFQFYHSSHIQTYIIIVLF
jgi:hypothetical protein